MVRSEAMPRISNHEATLFQGILAFILRDARDSRHCLRQPGYVARSSGWGSGSELDCFASLAM